MAPLPHVKTNLGDIRAHTRKVAEEIAGLWKLYFIWGIGDSGEHAQGRALDFMTYDNGSVARPGPRRNAIGEQIASYLVTNHKRLGVWYVIWNARIWSITYPGAGWRPYGGANPHTDHVHVSFVKAPPTYRPAKEDPMPSLTLAAIEAVVRQVVREEVKAATRVHVNAETQDKYGYGKAEYDAESIILDSSWRIRALDRKVEELAAKLDGGT